MRHSNQISTFWQVEISALQKTRCESVLDARKTP
jgi:hypothetical protein